MQRVCAVANVGIGSPCGNPKRDALTVRHVSTSGRRRAVWQGCHREPRAEVRRTRGAPCVAGRDGTGRRSAIGQKMNLMKLSSNERASSPDAAPADAGRAYNK
eukprot:841291-Pyramimonas_sp.AAC.1